MDLARQVGRVGGASPSPDESELRGRLAYAGLDLASSTDLAALVARPSRVADRPRGPRPSDRGPRRDRPRVDARRHLAERAERDRAPYLDWVRDGGSARRPGDVIDYDVIEPRRSGSSPSSGSTSISAGFTSTDGARSNSSATFATRSASGRVFEMGQGFASMSPPMKELEKLVLEGRLRHGANPLLRWAVASLAVAVDAAENIKPDRDKSTGRIDPFVALVMAVDAWTRDFRGRSRYEQEDEEEATA
jgi:phage terminase large subunit-like protein